MQARFKQQPEYMGRLSTHSGLLKGASSKREICMSEWCAREKYDANVCTPRECWEDARRTNKVINTQYFRKREQ